MKSSRVCRKSFRKASRVTCSSSCKRWSKGGTTSCQTTRECRKGHKGYKVSRIKGEISRHRMWQRKKRSGSSKRMSSRKRSAYFSFREEQDGLCSRQQNFRECRQEKKEEAIRRRWWNRSSLWEQIRRGLSSMICATFSSRNSRPQHLWRRCQEKEEEEGTVRTNKSKAKSAVGVVSVRRFQCRHFSE